MRTEGKCFGMVSGFLGLLHVPFAFQFFESVIDSLLDFGYKFVKSNSMGMTIMHFTAFHRVRPLRYPKYRACCNSCSLTPNVPLPYRWTIILFDKRDPNPCPIAILDVIHTEEFYQRIFLFCKILVSTVVGRVFFEGREGGERYLRNTS